MSLGFFFIENFAAREADFDDLIFWNWAPKNTPDRQKLVAFRKSQKRAKSVKSLHPSVQYNSAVSGSQRIML